jgi:uncharacterized membrane protein YuzA (DUF378 family)
MFGSKKHKSRVSSTDSGIGFFSWMGNLAAFYLILLAMISIPFLVLVAILFIRTFMDYYIWILVGIAAVLTVTLFFLIRHRKQIRKQFEQEKKDLMQIIRTAAREGHDVNISFLRGLISLDYLGSKNDGRLLGGSKRGQIKALPLTSSHTEPNEVVTEDRPQMRTPSVGSELEKLSGLFEKGLLTEAEYQELKEHVIESKSSNVNSP